MMKTSNHWKTTRSRIREARPTIKRVGQASPYSVRLCIIVALCSMLHAPCAPAETLVHPQRDDLAGRTFLEVGIPESTYTNGLVFYMDAAAGVYNAGATNFFIPDLSTNRNDATQPVINSQPISNRFDGVDDRLETKVDSFGLTNCSFAAWIFPEEVAVSDAGNHRIFSRHDNGPTRFGSAVDGGKLKVTLQAALLSSGSPIAVSNWYHTAVVKDGNDWQSYVDGVLVESGTYSFTAIANSSSFVVIGGQGGTGFRFFLGQIEDAAMCDKAATSNEIFRLYQMGKWRKP